MSMRTMALWVMAVLAGTTGTVLAQTTELSVPVCTQPPRIDADLADAAWTEAGTYTGFTRLGTDRLAGLSKQ